MDPQFGTGHRLGTESTLTAGHPDEMKIVDDLARYFTRYAKERPESFALMCLGVGFVLGWKLKPW